MTATDSTGTAGQPRYPVRLVALRTGLSPHALRAWERRYRVVTPTRSEGGQRLYTDLDVERLLRLRRLTERGHAIGRIAALPVEELARLEAEIPGDRLEPRQSPASGADADMIGRDGADGADGVVVAAIQATRRLDAVELQAVLERAAVSFGVPAFVDHVVAPFLERVGHGWTERSVSVAQEHMASAVVRRVLGWLLRVYEVRGAAPTIVISTPPQHAHELGALMAAASAAAEGWSVTYLGPDLPVTDLLTAVQQSGARAVGLSAVHQPPAGDLLGALRETRTGIPADVSLLVGGAAAVRLREAVEAAGCRVVESLAELRDVLRGLAEESGR